MNRKPIGTLSDDLASIARKVCEGIHGSIVTVWVNDSADVYVDPNESAQDIHLHSLVGTYTMGMNPRDVADDLQEFRLQRARQGILD